MCDDIEGRRVPLTPLGISDAPLRPDISDEFQQIAAIFSPCLVIESDNCLLQCRRKKVSPLVERDGDDCSSSDKSAPPSFFWGQKVASQAAFES